mgnify:CR=1 FL=1
MPDLRPANVVDLHGERDAAAGADLFPLRLSDLTYQAGGNVLIKGIDLSLGAGGATVIMGPNGAGKSLLLRLMHGLLEPSGGTVTWGGKAMSEDVRRRHAMVFQRAVMLRRSVAANIDFVLRLRGGTDKARRNAILEHAGLAAHADQPARLLSGGAETARSSGSRLPEQRLDHTSSAGCRVGHGLAVHGRRDPRCIFKHS